MKVRAVLLWVALLLAAVAITLVPTQTKPNADELRKQYPAVPANPLVDSFAIPLEALADSDLIAVVTPAGEPHATELRREGIPEVEEYRAMEVTVLRPLRGEAPGDTLLVNVPRRNDAFLYTMTKGQRYVLCLTAFDNNGQTNWGSGREFGFYLTDDDRLVPFAASGVEFGEELTGATLRSFLRLLERGDSPTTAP